MRPYGGYIAIPSNQGWLLWTAVEQIQDGPEAGSIIRRAVKYETIADVAS